jgi:hypothetical protein
MAEQEPRDCGYRGSDKAVTGSTGQQQILILVPKMIKGLKKDRFS